MTKQTKATQLSRHVALLRISFGLIWLIDASFKWQATFRSGFLGQVQSAAQGQPSWLTWWFSSWTHLLTHSPTTFALMVALTETLIALALLFGFARKPTYIMAIIYSLLIWGAAEGFGGPYSKGSTDIGTGIIYAVVFFALYGLDRLATPTSWSVDAYLAKKIPWWAVIANP